MTIYNYRSRNTSSNNAKRAFSFFTKSILYINILYNMNVKWVVVMLNRFIFKPFNYYYINLLIDSYIFSNIEVE